MRSVHSPMSSRHQVLRKPVIQTIPKVDHVNFLSDCLVTTFSFDYLQGSPLDAANESEVMGFIDLEYQRLTA